ncbi:MULTISPECIES: formyltetrahydrofolate deformylase [Prauserella salsuginis group]|uniref:Formyltetrahydrofolate deformylase n=1 Tax=Prauserella salsuginis TaxID=387889 RepID=A0ABW6G0S4_9PSEU|nr:MULTISPECIES: formyltetrahydrofolate deformylase [Prauserella salsuginis group]MCR3721963.1 formyltetrahydrofolate deformylase [Prauserella flava]MCR3735969.1 formyltetrahydrofolate deformylase [Prauserella salsuginis]
MTPPHGAQHGALLLSCPDQPGVVHAVSELLIQEKCTIVQSQQFGSATSGLFFMRVEFAHIDGSPLDFDSVERRVEELATTFDLTWTLADAARRQRAVIMVSKAAHCLNDLLFRNSIGELNLDVVAVVSNHPDLGRIADSFGAPFKHIPVTKETKAEAESALLELVREAGVDLVVLARYMQILSDDLCRQLDGKAINIHHSMLPSFKGAKPYHQAHARGVKFIGATAHYVTADLDEGPIIEQELMRVDHSLSPDRLAARGREAEATALARAVRWHTENRIAVVGNRTVVFP